MTNDKSIRTVLRQALDSSIKDAPNYKVIEELGVNHGSSRVDIALVNGIIHGFEIKSDKDNLLRLPEQIKAYGEVFDKITLVVGGTHLFDAIHLIPDWWGIIVARQTNGGVVTLNEIREAQQNQAKDDVAIARLLWREEALNILIANKQAHGLRSKPRSIIYEKLACSLDSNTLGFKVRETLCIRQNWRTVAQLN